MADNPNFKAADPGQGSPYAFDDVGGILTQRVKVQHGSDGAATDVSSASPLPVDIFSRYTRKQAVISVTAAGSTDVVAAVPGKEITVVSFYFIAAGAVNVIWQSGSVARSGSLPLVANVGMGLAGTFEAPLLWTAAGAALRLNLNTAVAVTGGLVYYEL